MLCIGVFELELIFVFVARMSPSQGLYGMTVWGEMDIAQVLSRTPVLTAVCIFEFRRRPE